MDPFLSTYDGSSSHTSERGLDMGSILVDSDAGDESFSSFFGGDVTSLRNQILELEASFCSSDVSGFSLCEKSIEADYSRSSFGVPDYIQGEEEGQTLIEKRRSRNLSRSGSHISDSTNGSVTTKSDHSALKARPFLMRKASQRAMGTLKSFTGLSSRNLQTEDQRNLLLEGHDMIGKERQSQSSGDVGTGIETEEKAPGRRGLLSRMRSRMAVHHDPNEVAEKPDQRPSLQRTTSLCFRSKFSRSMSSENVASQQEIADYSALGDDFSICSAEDEALQLSRSHLGDETPPCGSSASSDVNSSPSIAQFSVKVQEDRSKADTVDLLQHSIHQDGLKGCEALGEGKISNTDDGVQVQNEKVDFERAACKRRTKRATSSNRLERSTRRQLHRSRSGHDNLVSHSETEKTNVERSCRSTEAPRRTVNKSRVRRTTSSSLVELSSGRVSESHGSEYSLRRGEAPRGSSDSKKSSRRSTMRERESAKISGGTDRRRKDISSKKLSESSRDDEKVRQSPRTSMESVDSSIVEHSLGHSSITNSVDGGAGETARPASRNGERRHNRSERHGIKSKYKHRRKDSKGVVDIGDAQPLSDDSIPRQGLVAQSA